VGGNFCNSPGASRSSSPRVRSPVRRLRVWSGATLSPGARTAAGLAAGGYLSSTPPPPGGAGAGRPVLRQRGERLRNLAPRAAAWSFEDSAPPPPPRGRAPGRVRVDGGTPAERRAFYTALYHVFQNPAVASDVDGRYRDYDETVRSARHVTYQNFSGWDIYRSWIQLMAVLAPRETTDIVRSMVEPGCSSGTCPSGPTRTARPT
jgi:hypothetical protein